ncbi:MAG: HEPN domain-containing protein [Melioribacteraceae bacterium]|nr:HEPN domain-containing protein [Melioribacteraceae bacterium]
MMQYPPKIHRLDKLAELSNLELAEDMWKQLKLINDFNISARYPDYKNDFRKICTKEFAEEYLLIIENIFKWILEKLKN